MILKGEEGVGGEKEMLIGCLQGLNLQPRHVPWSGIKPATFSYTARRPQPPVRAAGQGKDSLVFMLPQSK